MRCFSLLVGAFLALTGATIAQARSICYKATLHGVYGSFRDINLDSALVTFEIKGDTNSVVDLFGGFYANAGPSSVTIRRGIHPLTAFAFNLNLTIGNTSSVLYVGTSTDSFGLATYPLYGYKLDYRAPIDIYLIFNETAGNKTDPGLHFNTNRGVLRMTSIDHVTFSATPFCN